MRSSRFQIWTAAFVLILLLLPGPSLKIQAQETKSKIRRIYVPADAPESWPAGDWTPIPAEKLTRAERQPADETLTNPWIKHARYAATFRDGTLQDGQFAIEIESPENTPPDLTSLLSWESSNVAFTNLQWEDQPAQLGTILDGKTLLLVPRGQRQLSGEWSLRGRPLAYGYQFRLQLPPAAVNEITLYLPPSAVFKTFDQTQWEWLETPSPESRAVRLALGSRTSVDFAVLQFGDSESTATDPTILTDSKTLIALSRDQSLVRLALSIEALEAPLPFVVFELPNGVTIQEVELGGRPLKDWSTAGDRDQLLRVNFPEPITNVSRPLRLTGTLSHPLNETWRLRPIVPIGSSPLAERVTINVTPPFELLAIDERGYRQTAASTTSDGSGSLVFEAISPDGHIDLRVGQEEEGEGTKKLRTELATRISYQNRRRTAVCELAGQVSSGRLYLFTMELAPEWNPTSIAVKLDTEEEWFSGPHWWITESETQRLLNVELPRAVSRDQSLALRMNLQQSPSSTQRPPVIPVVRTQSEVPCDQLIVLNRGLLPADRRPRLPAGWSEIEPEDGPEWFRQTEIGKAEINGDQWALFTASSPDFLQLPDTSPATRLSVRSEDRIELGPSNDSQLALTETVSLHFEDLSQPLTSLNFSSTSDASLNMWNWNVADHPEIEVQCVRATTSASAADQLQHWKLVFVPSLSEPATVTAVEQTAFRNDYSAVLPVVQDSLHHSGRMVVEYPRPAALQSAVELTSSMLEQPVPADLSDVRQFESGYMETGASLRIRRRGDLPPDGQKVCRVRWESWFPTSDSKLLQNTLKIEIPAGNTKLTGTWPASIEPPTAWIDDVPVAVSPDEAGHFEMHWGATSGPAILEIEFVSPIDWNYSDYRWSIPLPQFDLNVQSCIWTVRLPDDCRIAEYSEPLSLSQSSWPSDVHWTRRFFGPLGRSTRQEFFQPLNVAEWRSLLESQIRPVEHSGDVPSLSDTNQAGLCRFRLQNWPDEVHLQGWSESRQARYAWACYLVTLIFGVLIRISRWDTNRKLTAWSLSILGLVAWTAPLSISMFTGAIFAAIVTTALIPRPLLLGRRGACDEAEMQLIEGSTLKGMIAQSVLWGLILCAAGHLAAQPPLSRTEGERTDNPQATTIDVLIPFTGSKPPEQLPNFVYLRESDRQLPIFQELPSQRPVLFTSAEYDCRLAENETPTIRVRLQAELPVYRQIPLLAIPLAGANLAREGACFVDGVASPVSMTPEGLLEISLPEEDSEGGETTRSSGPLSAPRPPASDGLRASESRTVKIELNLYPPVSVQGTVQQWELQIPTIANSHFRCEYPRKGWPVPRLEGSRGEVTRIRDGLITADLGKSTRISCQWSDTGFPESDSRPSAQVNVRPIVAVELLPTHLRYRIQTQVTVSDGHIEFLNWHVPVSFHLHNVISDDVVLQTREVTLPAEKRITFDLTETLTPQSGPRIIEAEFIVALSPEQVDEIPVLIPDLLASERESSTGRRIISTGTTAGFWSPPELPLSVLELSVSEIQTLTSEEFLKFWTEGSLPSPERVYVLETPATLTFLRTSTQPQKEAWVHETGIIGDQYLDWEWNAEVKTSRLPAFQHEFQVDPRLEILSVSVRESQVERVHRWSREGSRLAVRLIRKTEEDNSQDVTIRGRILLSAEQQLDLPEISLVDSDRRESLVDLYVSPHRTARWASDEVPSSALSPSTTAANRGDLTLFDSFTRRDDDPQHRTVIVERKVPPPYFERVATLRRRSDGDFDVSVLLTEQSTSISDDSLEVTIPEQWLPRLRPLTAIGAELEPLAQGGGLITIPPESRSLPFVLRTTLTAPQDAIAWTVPWPALQEEATYHNLVSLRLADGWAPHIDCRIDPADDLQSASLSTGAVRWEYLCDTLDLQRTELTDPEAIPTVMKLLATINLQPGKTPHGQWWILYRGRGQKSMTLESPIALHNITAEINSQSVEPDYDAKSRSLTIPLLAGASWQSCIVDWESETPLPRAVMSDFQLQMPRVIDLDVRDSQVILVTHPDLRLTLHHDLKPESSLEFRLKLLETVRDVLQSGEFLSADIPDGLSTLIAALLAPVEHSPPIDGRPTQSDTTLQQDRLSELQQEVRELLPADQFGLGEGNLSLISGSGELTVWQSVLPGILAQSERPDRTTIYFSIPENPVDSKVWWMSRTWYGVGIAVAIALVLIPVSSMIIRSRMVNWAMRQRPVMWLLIGLIWWSSLQLSAVGLFIAAAAVIALGWKSVAFRAAKT